MLSSIATIVVTCFVLVFTLMNRQVVTVNLWPLSAEAQLPLYLLMLVTLFVGLFLGMTMMWIKSLKFKRSFRTLGKYVDELEKQVNTLKATTDDDDLIEGRTP
jgi:uncharacterized integral membrane protein